MCRQIVAALALTLALGTTVARPSQAQWQVDGAPVCSAAYGQGYPTIVPDGAGGAIITWEDGRNGVDWDIYAQRVDAAGVPQWAPDGVALCTAASDQYYPRIVSDGIGGAIIAWEDYRSGTDWTIYAQRLNRVGVPQWSTDGVALCTVANAKYGPWIVSDGAGGAIATWEDHRGPYSDIYAQRVDEGGVPQWTPNGVALCTAAYEQDHPRIAPDHAGGAIVTWADGRSAATSWDIYAQRVNAAGVPQWTIDGVPLCTAPSGQGGQSIVADGAGGAIVAWGDYRSGSSDIYAQHVLASGAADPAWSANGVLLCNAAGDQQFPVIVSDGAGGAIAAWESGDIYARRVDAAGVPQWTNNGVPICTAADDQQLAQIVSDGADGAIVAWEDIRDLNSHIYVQHVLATGAVDPAWTANGVPLSTAGTYQASPTIASDDAGGAIVAWHDYRSGTNYDVYAQRVYGGGAVAAVSPAVDPAGFQSLALSPNPFRSQLTIRFALSSYGRVLAQVLDLAGHRVRTLVFEREFSSVVQSLGWDGRDDAGARMPSGVYFVEVRVGKHSETRRAVLLH